MFDYPQHARFFGAGGAHQRERAAPSLCGELGASARKRVIMLPPRLNDVYRLTGGSNPRRLEFTLGVAAQPRTEDSLK